MFMFIWYFRPQYVKLNLLAQISESKIDVNANATNFDLESHWCFVSDIGVYKNFDINDDAIAVEAYPTVENLQKWGIDFDELGINFNDNNVILSYCREIKEMEFIRANWFPYQITQKVRTIMSNTFIPDTIYIYVIPKYDIGVDLKARTNTCLEQ